MDGHVEYGGFNCTLVNEQEAKRCCSVCRSQVLKEPEVTDCCRNYFCASCLRRCRETSYCCPLCRAPSFTSRRDSQEEKAMLKTLVYCQHKELGCTWTGMLRQHGAHVVLDCPHGLTECTLGCKQILVRSELQSHLELHCCLRRVRCRYCRVEGTCSFISHSHEKICPKLPMACPNGCEGVAGLFQENLQAHLRACPLASVPCNFAPIGCSATVPRRELREHLTASQDTHLQILLGTVVEMKRAIDSSQAEINSVKNTLRAVQQECERLRHSIASKQGGVPSPTSIARGLQQSVESSRREPFLPVFLKMGHLDLQREKGGCWFSSPFYTTPAGYKLCLGVFLNGREKGEGTHLAVHVHVMGGEYDDHLLWPLKHDITVILRNQLTNGHHLHLDCSFTELVPGLREHELDSVAVEGSGTNQFVLLSKLGLNQQRNTEYARGNCFYFEVC